MVVQKLKLILVPGGLAGKAGRRDPSRIGEARMPWPLDHSISVV
jgi:hypothetical protein